MRAITGWDDVATKADLHEGFAQMVTRDELGELLRLHVDARVGEMTRTLFFAIAALNAATITGVAAVRL